MTIVRKTGIFVNLLHCAHLFKRTRKVVEKRGITKFAYVIRLVLAKTIFTAVEKKPKALKTVVQPFRVVTYSG